MSRRRNVRDTLADSVVEGLVAVDPDRAVREVLSCRSDPGWMEALYEVFVHRRPADKVATEFDVDTDSLEFAVEVLQRPLTRRKIFICTYGHAPDAPGLCRWCGAELTPQCPGTRGRPPKYCDRACSDQYY